jgi:hypothetical protein
MKKMMVVVITLFFGLSTLGIAWAACGGHGFRGNAGYGCFGFNGSNALGWCRSVNSYVHQAANCCLAGIADFFEGSANYGAPPASSGAHNY